MLSNSTLMSSLKKTLVATALAAAINPAGAATLGKLTVLSGYGEPLKAEITLESVARHEQGKLVASVASKAEFDRAKVDMLPALQDVKVAVEERAGKFVIVLTSTKAMEDPYMPLLVEVTGARRKLLRQYSVLLDPPASPAKAAQVTAPVVGSTDKAQAPVPASAPETSAPVSSPKPVAQGKKEMPAAKAPAKPAQNAAKPATKPAAPAKGAGQMKIAKGSTLSEIAATKRPKGVSLNQMMIALYRANPDAFINHNINRMRAGEVLTLPSAAEAAAVAREEANQIVVAQATDFEAYRHALAGKVAKGAAQKRAPAKQDAAGKIDLKLEEKNDKQPQDQLKLSAANSGGKEGRAGAGAAEDRVASGKAREEADARIRELEKNLADMQKLLELKNQNLAMLSQQGEGKVTTQETPLVAQDADKKPAQPLPTPEVAEDERAQLLESDKEVPPSKGDTPLHEDEKKALTEATPEEKKATETGVMDWLKAFALKAKDSPELIPAAGGVAGILAALGGLVYFFLRRRKNGDVQGEDGRSDVAAGGDDLNIDLGGMQEGGRPADVDLGDKIDFNLELDGNYKDVPELAATDIVTTTDATTADAVAAPAAATPVAPATNTVATAAAIEAADTDVVVEEAPEEPEQPQAVLEEPEVSPEAVAQEPVAPVEPVVPAAPAAPTQILAPVSPRPEPVIEPVAAQAPEPVALDDAAPAEVAHASLPEAEPEKIELDLPESPVETPAPEDVDASALEELNTKLDLAEAYLDIGDKEGAREVIDEVAANAVPEVLSRIRELQQRLS